MKGIILARGSGTRSPIEGIEEITLSNKDKSGMGLNHIEILYKE
jgi:dTDP-glucose pyrophosphorylase